MGLGSFDRPCASGRACVRSRRLGAWGSRAWPPAGRAMAGITGQFELQSVGGFSRFRACPILFVLSAFEGKSSPILSSWVVTRALPATDQNPDLHRLAVEGPGDAQGSALSSQAAGNASRSMMLPERPSGADRSGLFTAGLWPFLHVKKQSQANVNIEVLGAGLRGSGLVRGA